MLQFISHNPYSEKTIQIYPCISADTLEKQIKLADDAQKYWAKMPITERASYVTKLSELILLHKESLARLATLEMGKTFNEALIEVQKCTTACEYYASHSAELLQTEISDSGIGKHVALHYEPMGVVLGIFPWNFPYWQIIRSAIPVLMGGNTMLVKPAPNTPQCALALQRLFVESGFPEGVIQTLFANEQQIAEMIADERIKACTLTGSEKAGAAVASQAGLHIKQTVLELGGSDPFIVLKDADLALAADMAITARFQNNGQSCIASKRFILAKEIANPFLQLLTERVSKLILGDPMDVGTHIGPIARADLRDKLQQQVDESVKAGAQIHYVTPQIPTNGYFYPPTILTHIPVDSPAYQDEIFGPVISVIVASGETEAIRIANDTTFGLGASIWTQDLDNGKLLARQIEAGQVFINAVVKSNAQYPFGGVKHSGIGYELGAWGIKAFCHVKTVWS
jgi:succinate-semialdehyde dehydrogenase/glutarate-semialdehyde dehydrogenase